MRLLAEDSTPERKRRTHERTIHGLLPELERLSIEDLDRSAVDLVLAEKQNVALSSPTSPRSRGGRPISSAPTRTSSCTASSASG